MSNKLALYFGCWDRPGHYLHEESGRSSHYAKRAFPGIPWDEAMMDTGLLKNGGHPDTIDGKVFWTCGGRDELWFAFFWWDRSGDSRGNSNSGFYVRGFGHDEQAQAFAYACERFPHIVKRQRRALVLQDPENERGKALLRKLAGAA
jgi:hypothetical protein